MKILKTALFGALLTASMASSAITTTFSGLDGTEDGAGFSFPSIDDPGSVAVSCASVTDCSGSWVGNANLRVDLLRNDNIGTAVQDFFSLTVGAGETARIAFNPNAINNFLVNGTGTTIFNRLSEGTYNFNLSGVAATNNGNYRVNVSAVPVPAAVWMMGTGLIGLLSFRKRKAA